MSGFWFLTKENHLLINQSIPENTGGGAEPLVFGWIKVFYVWKNLMIFLTTYFLPQSQTGAVDTGSSFPQKKKLIEDSLTNSENIQKR